MPTAAAKPRSRDAFSLRLLIVRELTRAGAPLTSRQLADRLNARVNSVAAACSRLANYGEIEKDLQLMPCRTCGSAHTFYLWALPK